MKISCSFMFLNLVYGASCAPRLLFGHRHVRGVPSRSAGVSVAPDNATIGTLNTGDYHSPSHILFEFLAPRRHVPVTAQNITAPVPYRNFPRYSSSSTSSKPQRLVYNGSLSGREERVADIPLGHISRSNPSKVARKGVVAASAHAHTEPRDETVSTTISREKLEAATRVKNQKRSPQNTQGLDLSPTPAPTGSSSSLTTVYINDDSDFAILLPKTANELISDAETDGESFCTTSGCANPLPDGFITAASVQKAPDGESWIQVTGCIDPSKFPLSPSDDGGQFDVRFPNGAQCTFGGYGASFIEQVEPSANRFCLRCCSSANDQVNCNSHQDRAGCPVAVPGTYDFPDSGVSCS